MADAACRHMPAELFFPEEGGRISDRAGKAVCNTCPTRIRCLEYAVTTRQHVGIWGGTSETAAWAVLIAVSSLGAGWAAGSVRCSHRVERRPCGPPPSHVRTIPARPYDQEKEPDSGR